MRTDEQANNEKPGDRESAGQPEHSVKVLSRIRPARSRAKWPAGVYEPRNLRAGPLFALVEDYHEDFGHVYDECYQQQYGVW